MNKNIDLCEILKNCPKGTKLYSTVLGDVTFEEFIEDAMFPIIVFCKDGALESFTALGKLKIHYDGECTLFPSKEQRDWSKFTASWYKKEKFDPKTLNHYDKVLARDSHNATWLCKWFSHIDLSKFYKYATTDGLYRYCIPYNDDTKHLVGTTDEAPEFYRYWED